MTSDSVAGMWWLTRFCSFNAIAFYLDIAGKLCGMRGERKAFEADLHEDMLAQEGY